MKAGSADLVVLEDDGSLINNSITIDRVVVKNLFNLFDYDISFKNDENVSIFIAPNGCGKTTIFNFLNFFSDPTEETFENIKNIPYDNFVCYYSNGTEISLNTNKKDVDECEFYNKTYTIKYKEKCETVNLYNVYKDLDYNPETDKVMATVIRDLNFNIAEKGFCAIPDLCYISANRLVLDNVGKFFSGMMKKAKKMGTDEEFNMLKDISYGFTNVSTLKEISDQIKVNSIDIDALSGGNKEFNNLFKEKINLLIEIFNKRNTLTRKIMTFSKSFGLQIFQNGKLIPLDCLSSGEKNDLVVFYKLIFQPMAVKNYIIDEPEISLHIQWQKEYVDYILQIAKMNNTQVIIATHSPSIINGHFELYADKKVEVKDE